MFGVVVAQYSKLDFKARFCADNAVKPQTAHKAKSAILFFIKVYLNFPISIILNVVSKGGKTAPNHYVQSHNRQQNK